MKDIHKFSSYIILLVIAAIAIISIFDGSIFFVQMAQAMTIPAFIFSIVNLLVSIENDIQRQVKIYSEKYEKLWECQHLLIWHTDKRLSEMREHFPNHYMIGYVEKDLDKYKDEHKTIEAVCNIFTKMKEKNNAILNYVYIISSVLVILSMVLSQRLFEIFPFITNIKLPVITFLALLISMGGVLIKDQIADKRLNKLYNIEMSREILAEKTKQEETKNDGQT